MGSLAVRRLEWMQFLLLGLCVLVGCRGLHHEPSLFVSDGDHAANYRLIFDRELPRDMTIANSIVVSYEPQSSANFPDDFEFEFLAPLTRIRELERIFGLRVCSYDSPCIEERLSSALRSWYTPEPRAEFVFYRDITSVGYVHMQVSRKRDADGNRRVFLSKH